MWYVWFNLTWAQIWCESRCRLFETPDPHAQTLSSASASIRSPERGPPFKWQMVRIRGFSIFAGVGSEPTNNPIVRSDVSGNFISSCLPQTDALQEIAAEMFLPRLLICHFPSPNRSMFLIHPQPSCTPSLCRYAMQMHCSYRCLWPSLCC